MPCAISKSSAVVLHKVLYNIGGSESTHSVMWYPLMATEASWHAFNLVNSAFIGFENREATLLEGKIVYFGDSNVEATYILKRKEESEELEVMEELQGF